MTTHEVEEMLGITKQSLIYYEKEGLIHPKRNENNLSKLHAKRY